MAKINDELEIWEVDPYILKEQDINPNVQTKEMFEQLVANIKKRGALESLPYCWYNEETDTVEIISGHHRVWASRAAELEKIPIILDRRKLTRDEIIAKQLAHNTISGTLDKQMASRLFEEIQSVDAKLEAFFNVEMPEITKVEEPKFCDINFDFEIMTFVFLPSAFDKFDDVLDMIEKDTYMVNIADKKAYDKFFEALMKTKRVKKIRNSGLALEKMAEIVLEHLSDEELENEDK